MEYQTAGKVKKYIYKMGKDTALLVIKPFSFEREKGLVFFNDTHARMNKWIPGMRVKCKYTKDEKNRKNIAISVEHEMTHADPETTKLPGHIMGAGDYYDISIFNPND